MSAAARGHSLFIYWSVAAVDLPAAVEATRALQRRLATEWTGLDAELLQRADGEAPGRATLMEVYRRTGGIDASIEAAIAAAAAEALAGIPAGPRHVEVFAPAGD